MQYNARVVRSLSKRLSSIVDMFEGIGEHTIYSEYATFYALERDMAGTPEEGCALLKHGDKFYCLGEMLAEAGFTVLGNGYFSIVFNHADAPGTAFKLSLKTTDSYVAFAMYCRQHPGMHLPEIRCMIRGVEGQVIALKEYQHYNVGAEAHGLREFPHNAAGFLWRWHEADKVRGDNRHLNHFPRSLEDALCRIGEFFDGAAEFDLHSDNIMYDPDSCEFIITDPVSFTIGEPNHAVQQPRKASTNPTHHEPISAGGIAEAFARVLKSTPAKMRRDVQASHPCPFG